MPRNIAELCGTWRFGFLFAETFLSFMFAFVAILFSTLSSKNNTETIPRNHTIPKLSLKEKLNSIHARHSQLCRRCSLRVLTSLLPILKRVGSYCHFDSQGHFRVRKLCTLVAKSATGCARLILHFGSFVISHLLLLFISICSEHVQGIYCHFRNSRLSAEILIL